MNRIYNDMIQDMKTTFTRLFTVLMLMIFSMVAQADVKVLFGDKGAEKYEGSGGSIKIEQADSKDDKAKVKVYLTFIPNSGYTFDEKSLKVYAVVSPDAAYTRAPEISGDPLELTPEKTDVSSAKRYSVDIDSKLALWVKSATFLNGRKDGDYSGTYFIKSESANKKTPGDYYLCPTEGWIYFVATNTFTEEDNGQPFLTTYQCKADAGYDLSKAIWKIEKIGNYYTIRHVFDGKYMVYNVSINSANANRIRVHLEDVVTPGDNELFVIGTNTAGKIVISPKGVSNYFNVCQGNINSLAGSTEFNKKAKNDGPTTPTDHQTDIHGTIGLWNDKNDENAPFELEDASSYVCETPTITYNESNGQVSLSTTTDGATIYYTVDGSQPTSSSTATAYTGPFTVSSSVVIQAIAVKEGKFNSLIASKQLVKYVYKIVNLSGNIAIQYAIPHPVSPGSALSGYDDIPAAIRSPYISDETIKFWTSTNFDTDNPITETPATGTDIYVNYTISKLQDKFLKLRGARSMNIKLNGEYIYDNSGILAHESGDTQKDQANRLWSFSGNDPYDVKVQNAATKNYLHYDTPANEATSASLSLTNSPSAFILMSGSGNDTANPQTYEQFELLAATGDGNSYRVGRSGDAFTISTTAAGDASLQVRAYPNSSTKTYYLIDRAGKLILSVSSKSEALALPDEWRSPLADYKYWNEDAFNISEGTYTLKEADEEQNIPAPQPITLLAEATGDVYVTYTFNGKFDLTGDKNYLLRFSDGVEFCQEKDNGVLTTATKAIYPYNNGDFNLNVYGQAQWDEQRTSGTSTRTRWLWQFVSSNNEQVLTGDDIDPYHVIIRSNQNQSIKVKENGEDVTYPGKSYLHTYQLVIGNVSKVVTGVVAKHGSEYNNQYSTPTDIKPTEYMILGTKVENMKLVTFDEIDNQRQTVTSFEQYWKNSPTVENLVGEDPAANNTTLTAKGWYQYQAWAYAEPWGSGTKVFSMGDHWFQTISMGSGDFTIEEVVLTPQVVLLDQHGWEILRMPMYTDKNMTVVNEELKKFDSPMVETYHWYNKYDPLCKTEGYHQYKFDDQKIVVYNKDRKATTDRYTHDSKSLFDIPYPHIDAQFSSKYGNQDYRVKTDFYVTYTVKSEYAYPYGGAARASATQPSLYMLKQGDSYAKIDGTTLTGAAQPNDTQSYDKKKPWYWYLRPNFNIDREMGYKYTDKSQDEIEQENYDDGLNGFDPYNVQIQSLANTSLYFTANTSNSALSNGGWTGTSSSVSLMRMTDTYRQQAESYDQTVLNITNATFMIVGDGSGNPDEGTGNMRLMPRFDQSKVVTAFNSIASPLEASDANAATQYLSITMVPKVVHNSSEITSRSGSFLLASDFSVSSSIGTETNPFIGTIDGQLTPITGAWSAPLVAYAKDATIKNIVINYVSINETTANTNVGAIVSNALGETRIFNCGILGGSVGGTKYVGGLVGLLEDKEETNKGSRVINCFSYADVNSGSEVGGIVGYNGFESKANDIRTMVMNCMFYGDITGGSTVSPVFGGYNIANLQGGLNTFNYYAYDKLKTKAISNNKYNSALAVEEKFLNRFEFYRLLLNSNKKLAAFYITGNANDADILAKWVLETADRSIDNPMSYPVLKAQGYYPSIVNYDTRDLDNYTEENRNQGLKTGTLSVTINQGSDAPTGASITTTNLTLTRTDKDFDRFNYNYDKVQLPYYNDVGTGNYTGNRVVTGWKITAITAVADDPYTASNYPTTGITDYPNHNYADRKSSNKDLYSVSKRVFSQGAYFDVPYGVESITIEPYWGNAIYVADQYYDVVYKNDYSGKQGVSQVGTQAVDNTTTFNGQKIRTSITGLGSGTTVYDNAVVLVGNFHLDNVPTGTNGTTPFTMMSVDEDNDHEPDYSLIYHHKSRSAICPIRFDFLNIPGTAQAQKPNGASLICNFTIFKTRGWFEVTNTSSFYSSQLEYENIDGVTKSDAPLILQGGVIDQFVSTQSKTVPGKTIYIHVGGNVWIKEFGMGTHSDGSESTPHVPVSVTGGEFPGFYLTGTYKADAKVRSDNAECYISGGYFHEVAGASLEQIDGNVHWQIYNADIDNFFGGGINDAKPIKGDITVDIYNSHVTTYCGGPKFGNMQTGKKVTTNAEGCVFGKYFGAGFGGTSIAKKKYYDLDTYNWNTLQGYFTTDRGNYFNGTSTGASQISGKDYGKKGPGVATDFNYEFFVWTSGKTGARFYVNFASFSLAQCNDVESNLKGCTINQSFYGGGSLGKVVGKATSVLDGCTVHGNVFGGGYSADIPTIQVRDAGFTTNPNYNSSSGMFEPGVFSGTTEFTWKNAAEVGKTLTNNQSGSDLTNHYLYTNADLTTLGQVKETDLTVTNNCKIDGGVFGGGDESSVNENTLVKIENAGGENAIPNVYGGGNTADVEGNTEVRMTSGTVSHDIYGGGRGETTIVGGNVTVNMGAKTGEAPSITYSGTGVVQGDVYGGSALGKVNTTSDKTTTVNVYAGTINGSVFGGGLGQVEVAADPEHSIVAKSAIVAENQGETTVNVEGGLVKTAVYGGSNVNGVLKKNSTVTLIGGTVGDSEDQDKDVVFGGGKGAPTLVNGNVTVNVGTMTPSTPPATPTYAGTATIYGHVYGGGALGNVNASKPESALVFDATKETLVNLYAGTINGYAYGGGLGSAETPAYVGGDVTVTLDGAKVKQVFGANNINGTPKGHVKVWVKRTNNFTSNEYKNNTTTPRASRTTYDVEAVYGGGNKADYVPTKATGTVDDKKEAYAEVLIEGCEKTSIDHVYGGGNAAAVPATEVTVKGTYIINTLYGGGNGAGYMDPPTNSIPNPGANVGIYKDGDTPINYGTGIAKTKLLGGYINDVFGGSNTKGDVIGGTDVQNKKKDEVVEGDCCPALTVGNVYGAGSHADVSGGVNIVLECMPEDFVDAVYGGAEEATVDGNVTLTVTSGKFGRVFGGNNKGGNIRGSITVYINEYGCKPLIIGELYGGGNAAPYSIYGCSKDGTAWKPNETGIPYYDVDSENRADIEVNVWACTSIGKVFGGGMGSTAKVIGNTRVNINVMKGYVDTDGDGVEEQQENIGKIGQVFGGGGEADVIGNTLVNIGTALANEPNGVIIESGNDYLKPDKNETTSITAGIYGGGYSADVVGNTTINIGTANLPLGVNIAGDIFGGGFGETTHVTSDVRVNIGKKEGKTVEDVTTYSYEGYANITGDVYGGSAQGKVNSYLDNNNETASEGKTTHVNYYGGTITGNIYGGGLGDLASLGEGHTDVAADVYGPVTVTMEGGSVYNVFGCNNYNGAPKNTVTVNINGGTVNFSEGEVDGREGNVYGGGNQAAYTAPDSNKDNPVVYINNGIVTRNVFGGGLGETATVIGNPLVTIGDNVEGHKAEIKWSVYGGGSLASVDGNTTIVVNSGKIGTEGQGGATYGNIYGGGFGSSDNVRIGLVKGNTNITVNGGTILHSIYGGGAYGSVGTYTYASEDANAAISALATASTGKATIHIIGGTIGTDGHENGMIFGASRGDIAAPGAIQDNMAWVYDTDVIIGNEGDEENVSSPSIRGSIYGSGENGHTFHNAKVTIHSGMVGITDAMSSDPEGQEGSKYPYRGNVYGGGCGTDKYYSTGTETHDGKGDSYNATAGIVGGNATVTINGGHVVRNVYGAGAMGSVTGGTIVNISGKSIIGADGSGGGYVYAAARGETGMGDGLATVGSTTLNISGGTIWGSAFGGGQLGTVKGSVAVNVSGGVVKNDVYGGGALANTNTDNWNSNKDVTMYDEVTFLKVGESVVTGLYTKSASEYVKVTAENAKAENGVTYYRQIKGGWASDGTTSTDNTTKVTLTGGVIGNAYGGGLGDVTTPVYVYGDITLTVNDPEKLGDSKGIGFTREIAENVVVAGKKYSSVPITGNVFGCNNVNGTPRGDVTVTVYSTRQLDRNGKVIPNAGPSSHSPNATNEYYEIQAVYGGGNQANYQPSTGKNTHVIIYGCDETSIEKVYGGGNSAAVPQTDVIIWGSFDINSAFGGGNGSLPINRNGIWIESAGSEVYGNTNISCKGGKIGNVFGGSDAKGNVHGSMNTDVENPAGGCALKITKIYGASKEADVDGDVNIVISGCSSDEIEYVCGGSYNANIRGDITLTITSGILKNVYGGNDARGSIGGNITINIQEEDSCKPIIIQNLVGGGFAADYPGINFKTGENAKRVKRDSDGRYIKNGEIYEYEDFTEGKITVNVKSATRIDNIYGGGFRADVHGDTEVNVNMVKGLWAGAKAPDGYTDLPNVHMANYAKVMGLTVGTSPVTDYYERVGDGYSKTSDATAQSGKTYYVKNVYAIDDAIGTIGNVYGGGSEGIVYGNSIVNIGSSTTVPVMHRDGDGKFVTTTDVNGVMVIDFVTSPSLGAHITGDIFGGGSRADVTGNASVNICAKESATPGTYEAVAEGAEKVSIGESVYGGGSEADVLGNTNVTMAGGYVYDGVYGGGLKGSVGTYTRTTDVTTESNNFAHSTHADVCLGKPTACTDGTGTCTVVVSGGQVGPLEVATKGMKNEGGDGPVDVGFVFGAGRGDVENPNDVKDADFHTFVNKTDVTISGTALIMASVYGGGENGRVLHDTHVKIQGGQIGCGDAPGNVPKVYTEEEWASETPSTFKECLSWDYKSPFLPHDPYAQAGDAEDDKVGTDGHTYYGSVFGGGSGYYPYLIKNIQGTVIGHEWLRSAGAVYGNTVIDITGGHILTCVYGGNETTDVGTYTKNANGHPLVWQSGGKCTINMVGGTLGVPRTDADATKHPVTCYLFGAGKGDQRTHFNTWTNVQETEVNVSGTARIFGSVFGGGEDGHILGNAKVNIGGSVTIGETTYSPTNVKIGTTGTSYVDGNVFGGGRGFSGLALTAGSTGGNAEVNIMGGTMLGSIYGGGRLASVGIDFTPPTDPLYGQLVDDTNEKTHGHIAINISGGTIGNDVANAKYGGNVFGGSMGRITLLDGTLNPIWPKQSVTKDTEITITGNAIIKKNVYGGSEFGIVRDKAIVNIGGTRDKSTDVVTASGDPTIHGSVYGGGYGSDDTTPTFVTAGAYVQGADYVFTPMIWTGCVAGDTEVNIAGGIVKKNVYGGGEVASVGLINCHVVEDENGDITIKDEHNVEKKYRYTNLTKHADIEGTEANEKAYGFALSWPYKFEFIPGNPKSTYIGGKATVNVTGGHIGSPTWDDRTGYVFGGSKGQVAFKKKDGNELVNITDIHEQRYVEGLCANVRETEVNVKYSSTPSGKTPSNIGTEANCIMGAVYGGGEDGHVYENAAVNITGGLIGLSVYGGGKGEGTYTGTKYVYNKSTKTWTKTDNVANMPSWTAGKVYGNTSITMSNGHVMGNVYGGGNLGSVGKGNYAGGTDDYYPAGYGETLQNAPLWTKTAGFNPDAPITDSNKPTTMADYFLSSGKCKISITGGTVGTLNGLYGNVQGTSKGTPTGIVFGGSRGRAAQDVGALSPRYEYAPDFFLGYVNNTEVTIGTRNAETGPKIYSQVFGGARDGHVRGSAKVEINSGTIGQTYNETQAVGDADVDYQRYHRGNVYGAGSGLGTWDGTHHGTSSGSVTRNTTVDIYGGTIYNNVYGGGAMATVGPPKINQDDYATASLSKCTVNINGGIIGEEDVYNAHKFGGTIYGGSRGDRGGDLGTGETIENYATVLWTEVNIKPHPSNRTKDAFIAGNVYGGARGGQVKKDTKVNLLGGVIKHNAYGGGRGTTDIPADVLGNTTTELNKGVAADAKGCMVDKVFGCNDLNGTPKGHVLVHVYATQHKNKTRINDKYTKFNKLSEYTISNYADASNAADLGSLAAAAGLTTDQINAYKSAIADAVGDDAQKTAIDNYIEAIADKKYDVLAVYGGGDLAPYNPTSTEEKTEVIIDGCEETSIKQVYGGGNAASAPATKVMINSAYEIHESFGGGNGKDDYVKDNVYYENSGADVGYTNYHHYVKSGEAGYDAGTHGTGAEATPYKPIPNDGTDDADVGEETAKANRIANYSYGTGVTRIEVFGGRIHRSYGGSNLKGNIRYETSSQYEESGACTMNIDETYGGSKDAKTDADIHTDMKCLDYTDELYGGSTSGDVNSNIVLNITNGTFKNVYGGNKEKGRIFGSITVNVKEMGCKPIIIGGLYAGGYKADYSIYGYSGTEHSTARSKAEYDALSDIDKAAITVQKDPRINVISATRIDNIYGGGFQARIVGNPHINVNMEEGTLAANYLKDHAEYLTNDQTDSRSGTTVTWRCREGALVESVGNDGILPIGTIGNIFGGGDQANIEGNTCIEIGTGKHHNDEGAEEVITPARNAAYITGRVYGGGNLGDVTGNTTVEMSNGYVADRIFGGGKEGNVGTVTATSKHTGDNTHDGCIGKPTAFAANTGKCSVTVSGGYVGPFTYSHLTGGEAKANVTITSMNMPDDHGYVFGAGRGELTNPATDKDIDFRTYVKETEVIIKNTYEEAFEGDSLAHIVRSPLIAGGVYGGSENGRVLNNTHVNIWGGQIGLGATKTAAYAETAFIDPTTTMVTGGAEGNALAECAHWAYGNPWLPYDENAGNGHYQTDTYGAASTTGSDGHTFYGNVFGGGSGYFAYQIGETGVYEWLPSAGLVEGNTYVNISGGHILTNVYGGNEMTNVTGTTNVTMTGGTLGVPRTLAQIAAHPVTCYLFGAGKGDQRVHFNKSTNVGHAVVNVSGGIIYGSVFGGGEDGHVLGDVTMNISDGAKIGTWGTSYVDGNVFGGGRGFGGDAYTAGNVAGSVTLNITGGTMLGSIYGGGRLGSVGYGLFSKDEEGYGTMRGDNVTEDGFTPPGGLTKGRGHVEVNISGGTIGNTNEFIMPIAANPEAEITGNIPTGLDNDFKKWNAGDWTTWKNHNNVPNTEYDTSNGRVLHTKGGNVFAGGMGRYTQLDGTTSISTYDESGNLTSPIEWKKLGNVKSTTLTISGTPWIMGNVYGGGELGAVTPYTKDEIVEGGTTTISIEGGTIGTEVTGTTPSKTTVTTAGVVQYTYGSVYGGGMGMEGHDDQDRHGGEVGGNTAVSMSGENTEVRASVYGGGEMAVVDGNTTVTINNGKIGRNEVKPADDVDAGYVLFGGATMGNVYGGGKGSLEHTEGGLVKGNTNVTISGGNVYHNVYGGGALGSVGTFSLSNGTDKPSYIPIAGVPYNWKYTDGEVINPASLEAQKTPTGTATVTITGGTIGISGRDNGLVFGSSRGGLQKPYDIPDDGTTDKLDPYDRVAWVNKSVVTIGTSGSGTTLNTPLVKGSVYGGGENGHNDESATVNVYSGTIGITDTEDPWYSFTDKNLEKDVQLHRGNVYGAGSGSDTYTDDGKEHYNPKSGMVGGNTFVNIAGGHVGRSVYGGGAMASVGTITKETKHESIENGFGLSWPYAFEFAANTGKATVNVTGGHIGTRQLEGGDVYGSSRGEAGDRYEMADLAYTYETEVNINYPSTIDMTSETAIQNDFTTQCITGSVHGSGENGYVYGNTKVTLNEGLIGHSLYGAGKGKGTYTKELNKLPGSGEGKYDAKIYSLIAGKVMGNTYVTMNGGRVGRNVYGGGNMGSVGKGNYAGGADDYYPAGYGETITGSLWTSAFDPEAAISESNKPDDAYYFLSSGKATVKVFGGTVGYIDADPTKSMKNELPYGNVFGGSAGEAAPNIAEDPRYEYSPAFFSGYVNQTDVTIGGGYRCTTAYTIGDKTYKVGDAVSSEEYNAFTSGQANWTAITPPTIYASVYGGGQDGHVRRDTKVTVLGGEIGVPYKATSDPRTTLLTNYGLDDPQWMHRGNIYGGGSGITKYKYDFDHDGTTSQDANGNGIIEDNEIDTGTYDGKSVKDEDYSNSSGSVTRFTEVNVLGGTIHRNVYGGGSMGSVGAPKIDESQGDLSKKDLREKNKANWGKQSQNTVNIGGGSSVVTIGTPFDTTKGWSYDKTYGGEVYGACRGDATLDAEQFGTSIWTQVLIKNGANILGNVFGGGDAGKVKRDAEVIIGEPKGNNP